MRVAASMKPNLKPSCLIIFRLLLQVIVVKQWPLSLIKPHSFSVLVVQRELQKPFTCVYFLSDFFLIFLFFSFLDCVNCEGKSILVERKTGGEQMNFRWFPLSGNILVLH